MNDQTPYGFSTMSPAVAEAHNYTAWIVDTFRPFVGQDLLEIGTGFGNYRRHFPQTRTYTSVDIDAVAVAAASAADPSGRYLCADVSAPEFDAIAGLDKYDTVLCANVLEHIPDHRSALKNMVAALTASGHLLLFVPAHQALFGTMDTLAGHLRRYSLNALAELVTECGGRVIHARYFNPIGGIGWWVNRKRPYASLDDAGLNRQIRLFDRYAIPLSRALDPLTRGFFGQSLVLVARK
ncbi:MAG: class I SAM-dependent methyltransferase [Proteobacteria bacterium]|nr:class I SAM-dependent methyltransferase [Pseudomonadota bacterium]